MDLQVVCNREDRCYPLLKEVMEYLYFFDNASLSIWVIEYLIQRSGLPLDYVTIIYFPGGWLIRTQFDGYIEPELEANFRAVMDEFGYAFVPSMAMTAALKSLAEGHTPTAVMQRYRIAIVAHGKPSREDIEAFQQQFIQESGSCPKSLR